MIVRDALVRYPLVIPPETTLVEFIDAVLASNQMTASIVDSETRLVGTISAQDIYSRIVPSYIGDSSGLLDVVHEDYFDEKFEKFRTITVEEIMVREVDTIGPDEGVIAAVSLFVAKGRKSLPVIEDGRFIGVITRRSILRCVRGRDRKLDHPEWGL